MDSQTNIRPFRLAQENIDSLLENYSGAGSSVHGSKCESSEVCRDWKVKGFCLKSTCNKKHYEIDNEIAFDLPKKSLTCVENSPHFCGNCQPKNTPSPEVELCESLKTKGYCLIFCCKEHSANERITSVTQHKGLNKDPGILDVTSNYATTEVSCQSESCVGRGSSKGLNESVSNTSVDTSISDCASDSFKGYCKDSKCKTHNQTIKDAPPPEPDLPSTENNCIGNSDNIVVVIEHFGDPIAQVLNSNDNGNTSRAISQLNGFCNNENRCEEWMTKGYCIDSACLKKHPNIDEDLYFGEIGLDHSSSYAKDEFVEESSSSDSDDPELGKFIPDDEKNICRYFSEYGFCWKKFCRFAHVSTIESKLTNEKVECYVDNFNDLRLPGCGEMVTLFVTSVISPTSFYAHLPAFYNMDSDLGQFETLKSLTLALNDNNNVQDYNSLRVLPSDGELLLGQCSDSCWYRMRVIAVEQKKASVFLVDYGLYKNLKLNRLRSIQSKFLHLPFQAVHCRLQGIYDAQRSQEGIKKLENSILNRTVVATVTFTSPYNDLIEVIARVNGESVNDYMLKTGLVDPEP